MTFPPLFSRTSRGSPICCLLCCLAYGATTPAPTWLSSCYVWIITTISQWPGDNWAGKGGPRQRDRDREKDRIEWGFLRRLCGKQITHQIYLALFYIICLALNYNKYERKKLLYLGFKTFHNFKRSIFDKNFKLNNVDKQ